MNRRFFASSIIVLAWSAPIYAAPVELKLKFPPGHTDHITMSMETKQTVASEALPAAQKQDISMTWDSDLKFGASDSEGSTADMTYGRIRMKVKVGPTELSFDSDKKDDNAKNPLAGPLSAMVGVTLKLHFKTDGKVDKVEGIEEVVKRLEAQPNGAMGAQLLKQAMNSKQMKDTFNSSFAEGLPGKPVSIGDTWTSEQSQDVGGSALKMKQDSKLVAIETEGGHQVAKIEFTGSGKLDTANLPGGAKMTINELSQEGTKTFDIDRGWFSGADMTQKMKADSTANLPGGKTMTMKIDQDAKIKIKLAPGDSK